jgi:hypothetical protein
METPDKTGGRMRLLPWLGEARRRAVWEVQPTFPPRGGARRRQPAAAPWWVRAFVALGRPVVTVTVLVLCAPGEHHLAVLAGWSSTLAWGMAAVLAAYAGLAAVVAAQRPKGAPGHRTAVAGAGISLLLAMAAQPVSHLFVTGWLTADPRPPLWLVIIVSCVPAPVLAHLLHMTAIPLAAPEQPAAKGSAEDVPGELLTTKEVAERLGIKPSSVASRVHRGSLVPAMRDPDLGNLFDPAALPGAPVPADA